MSLNLYQVSLAWCSTNPPRTSASRVHLTLALILQATERLPSLLRNSSPTPAANGLMRQTPMISMKHRNSTATDKAFHLLNWQSVWDFKKTIEATAVWYLEENSVRVSPLSLRLKLRITKILLLKSLHGLYQQPIINNHSSTVFLMTNPEEISRDRDSLENTQASTPQTVPEMIPSVHPTKWVN